MDGELYEAVATYFACNERLCPSCLSKRQQRARRRTREAIARIVAPRGELWRLVTLTMPTLAADRAPLSVALEVLSRAWCLFRKRQWWSELVTAGVKGVEFTLGDLKRLKREGREWSPETDGYHVHVHLLILSGWVEWRRLREEWSACLLEAWSERGIEQSINTRDGLAVCDVRLVVNRKSAARGTISGEGAVNEVCKYITKSESWLKVEDSQLVEMASIRRWPRMFELIGKCREKRTPAQIAKDKASRLAREAERRWRAALERRRATISDEERIEALEAGAEVKTETRWTVEKDEETGKKQLTRIEVETVNDFKLLQQARAELCVGLKLEPETLAKLKERTAYLDTQNLSDGKRARDGTIKKRLCRPRPARDVAIEMIARGDKKKWLEQLAEHASDVRSFRRAQLAWRFPYATFSTLAGEVFYGQRVVPALPTLTDERLRERKAEMETRIAGMLARFDLSKPHEEIQEDALWFY